MTSFKLILNTNIFVSLFIKMQDKMVYMHYNFQIIFLNFLCNLIVHIRLIYICNNYIIYI